ncbi:Molybdenum cofactor biosynthesis, MoeB [Cynara cardunculus var. scolymus]|uniref:Molybdenum cofactor biosynthesis, MoeB n=1 Tax=Cynara cardunculus var. scolymus TaxID=59895 RepID=A0A103Y5V7_CYNCS|nr:Molybdenum cofactor biosynthesis, MoeB [Cynara cardunculus var. scolymus]
MEERAKSLALIAAGALLGSITATVAVLKLLPPRIATVQYSNGAKSNEMRSILKLKDCPLDILSQRVALPFLGEGKNASFLHYQLGEAVLSAPAAEGNSSLKAEMYEIDHADLLKDEIVSEQLTRNIQFFGFDAQQKVTTSYVVVIGLGGVGSHAASMLLRSGVGRLLLVDFDQVSLSSLNRHAVATRIDVGTPKALCLKKHFSSIYPECHIDAKVLLYDASSEEEILLGDPDFVLDCIDNIDTKVALLAACVRRGLKVLSATGAGARADPTRIRVADLRESTNDPLSRAVRQRLRRDHGIEGGIPVVFSLEKPKAKLLPFKGPNGDEENPSDYQVVPGFRVRIIPVLGTIPAIFGQIMASYVVTRLAELQVHMEPIVNFDMDHYRVLHQRLIEHEELIYGTSIQVQVDVEEVMYVAKELWRGRSARDQTTKVGRGMWRSVNELMLVRWDKSKPASASNLILLKFTEADEHESTTLEDLKEHEPEFFTRVTSTLKRAELDLAL